MVLQGDAKMGMDVAQGDRVVTFDESKMQIILKDETIITLGANSSFEYPIPLLNPI